MSAHSLTEQEMVKVICLLLEGDGLNYKYIAPFCERKDEPHHSFVCDFHDDTEETPSCVCKIRLDFGRRAILFDTSPSFVVPLDRRSQTVGYVTWCNYVESLDFGEFVVSACGALLCS